MLTGLIVVTPPILVALYLGVSLALVLFPAGGISEPAQAERIRIYVVSNGIHSELVLPRRTTTIDWTRYFPLDAFAAPPPEPAYVALGWGERAFYLDTPRWSDVTLASALRALVGRNRSVLHVTYADSLAWFPEVYAISLAEPQYARLTSYVLETLRMRAGSGARVPGRSYGDADAFFEANGTYNLFRTCNTWVGRGLRRAGVRVSRWTPFEWNVYWHLEGDAHTAAPPPGWRGS
jgi:uncharacterized protein (TIGR02117 family)